MYRLLTVWLAAFALFAADRAAADDQATSIPLSLSIAVSPSEIAAGDTASVLVRLRNYRGQPVAATEDVTITLQSELIPDATLMLPKGQFAAHTDLTFRQPGVATLAATAPYLTRAATALVVKAPALAPARSSEPVPAAPEAAGVDPSGSRNLFLSVDVLPDHIHPANASWQAKVLISAVDERRQPVAVPASTTIQLATDVGAVSPQVATIEAGHARISEPIQLTSTKAGAGTVWAWMDTGELSRATFEYHEALPTQLAVKALPTRTLNDGRTGIRVSVFLEDDTSMATRADTDMQVQLTASVGIPTPSIVVIPKGEFAGEAVLTSATAGVSEITATAAGMKAAVAAVEFVFPYALVLVAALGGLLGALIRSGNLALTGAWRWHLLDSLAIGSVLGLLFYLLAAFGIVASIPNLPIPIQALPTTNEFAALLLGFFGGFYARAWLPNPSRKPVGEATIQPSGTVSAT